MTERLSESQRAAHARLRTSVGVVPLPGRTSIEVTGGDRLRFLHNLCTNEVQSLQPGQGREAFFCSVQGKLLAHAFFWCEEKRVVVETVAGQASLLMRHLDKYLIADDVQLTDRSKDWMHWLVSGPSSVRWLQSFGIDPPDDFLQHRTTTSCLLTAGEVWCGKVDWAVADSFLVRCDASDSPSILDRWRQTECVVADDALFDGLRLEAGFPLFGIDITDQQLPQEIGRDARAISFTKGCYLGQETVARIDALGHVNWNLVRLQLAGPSLPKAGTEVFAEGQSVGAITSAAESPHGHGVLCFARLRREAVERLHSAITIGTDRVSAEILRDS